MSSFSTQRAAGPEWEAPCSSSESTLPLETHTLPWLGGNCPGNKEELKSWGISLQRKAGTPPGLSSFYLPCASSLLTPFPVSQKALSSILCSLRDYFHAWAMQAAATPMITLNVEVFNPLLTRFLFSHTSQEATSQANLCKTSWWNRTVRAEPAKVLPAAELAAGPGCLCPPWLGYAKAPLGRIYVVLHFMYQGRHYCTEQTAILKTTWKLLLKIEIISHAAI